MSKETESTLTLSDDEVLHIEAFYGITVEDSSFLGKGSGNTNYFLETNIGHCVFSIIEEQSREDVELMAKTLEWLEAHHYKTSLLIKPKIQKRNSVILREKPSLLRTYIDGTICHDFSKNMLMQLGAATAKLHTLPAPNFLTNSLFYEQDKFMAALNANIDKNYEGWAKNRLKALAISEIKDLPTSFIHSDLFFDNLLVNGDQFVGMIDFELACIYHSVFDIAMALVGTCCVNGILSPEKSKYLISGYYSARILENNEIKVLKRYTEYAAILTSLWRYWRYKIYQPNENKADKYLEMMKSAQSIQNTDFAELTNIFPAKT
ncbi:phosphotransferase [Aristophania vespae]|uniref:Phosphotransferase n=1 Tax=Aristophania vespae TaxID=2697033 RepID=A0A6P1ND86_9PROT|nr:phosphotransferase [Aristophania vespae]QHI95478.1 phosphotransferase [Aristophania vespae]